MATGGEGVRELVLVRHGESEGNVAAAKADAAAADRIDVRWRDADVPLSERGAAQADAVGAAIKSLPADEAPASLWCSPYRRALQTADPAARALGLADDVIVDERLRDRDLGAWDLLTLRGVQEQHADEAQRRSWLGKFYYRPFGGEAWTDVALRLRSLLRDIDDRESGRRVLVVAHDAIVLTFRYICEGLTESQVLEIGKDTPVANGGITRIVRDVDARTGWRLAAYNDVRHLEADGEAEATEHREDPDVRT